jgi:hypothetical protein
MREKFIILCFATPFCFSEGNTQPGVVAGLGAYSLHHQDVFSFSHNPASLGQVSSGMAGLYTERKYGVPGLNELNILAAIPSHSGGFGGLVNYSGSTAYHTMQAGFAYGKKLGSYMDLGLQLNFHNTGIAGYGKKNSASFDVGAIFHFTQKLHSGIYIKNPVAIDFYKEVREKMPGRFGFGIGFDASNKCLVSVVIEKEQGQPINIIAGFQYWFLQKLQARAGISSATSQAWMGFGFQWIRLRFDLISAYHPYLGWSPGFMIMFDFKKDKN